MNFSYRYRAEDSAVELPAADYIARFRDAQRIAEYCRACPSYGSSWGCPPFGFSVEEYLSGYVTALVVATKIVPEQEGLPLSEAGRLMRPERKRIEARLLDMERRIGGRSFAYNADFGAVFACISFAHDNSASKTGFSCSSRFSYRSSGVSSANACSSLKSREQ